MNVDFKNYKIGMIYKKKLGAKPAAEAYNEPYKRSSRTGFAINCAFLWLREVKKT